MILDAHGRPFTTEAARAAGGPRASVKSLGGGNANAYAQALASLDAPARARARDPFSNHAWVFAAAIMTAITAGQAPLQVMRETDATTTARRAFAKRSFWSPPTGSARRSFQRHMALPIEKRIVAKAAEPDFEHPLYDVLMRPNPMCDGGQLLALTYIWMAVRGEAFWLLTDDDGTEITPGEIPTRIWPISPDAFEAVLSRGRTGELVGWRYTPPTWMPNATGGGQKITVDLASVVQFKFPNPGDPTRGLSRISAAAHGIRLDMMIAGHQTKLLANNGIPRIALLSEEAIDPKDETEFMAQWKRTYGGEYGDAVAMLSGGFDIKEIALSPVDMALLDLAKWDRDTILAVMGVPPSKLGVTEFTNYATAMSQDFTFWSNTIVPVMRIIERALDGSLMFSETDSVFLMFDLTGIDALRAGLIEKLGAVEKLTSDKIHMPPGDAFSMVGIEAPEYIGRDTALINGVVAGTVKDLLENPPLATDPAAPVAAVADPAKPTEKPNTEEPPAAEPTPTGKTSTLESARRILVYTGPNAKARAGKRWKGFVRLQAAHERAMIAAYRKWVAAERKATLERFDAVAGKQLMHLLAAHLKDSSIDLTAVLPDPDESGNKLKNVSRPVRTSALHETYDFTLDDIGIPTFEVDDPKLHKFFDLREKKFVSTTPNTIITNLRNSLTEGFKTSETVQQLRSRVAQVYDVSASSAKALTVARTETANFMNGVRDQMFDLQGFEEEDWVTAGDENVRESHVTYGAAGAQKRGFNYMTLTGGGPGQLRYPGDLEAPAAEVVNCRCMKVPVG